MTRKEIIGKTLLALIAVGTIVGTTGCARMVEGVVVGKRYDDPDTWTSFTCAAYNSKGFCTMQVPVQNYDGPHWYFELDGTNSDGKRDHGEVEVGADEYNIFGIGAVYPGRPGEPVEYAEGYGR